jgi:hypothetical protein
VALAEASADDYVLVQILNALGAARFDRATSKLAQPHARAHLTSLDLRDVRPMEEDARAALVLFERAREVANRAKLQFAAWFVAGNIERLEILLGNAERAVAATRKRLAAMQKQGARYDEIVCDRTWPGACGFQAGTVKPCTSSTPRSSLPVRQVPSTSCSNSSITTVPSCSRRSATTQRQMRAIGATFAVAPGTMRRPKAAAPT